MRVIGVVLGLVLVAAGTTMLVPASDARESPEPHVTDPEGDAREYNSEMVRALARRNGCGAVWPAAPYACQVADDAGAMPQPGSTGLVGGVPASPALDVLAAWFEETPTHLVVHAQVAALDPSFAGIRSDDALGSRKTAGIGVWWGDPRCWEAVDFFIDNTDGGRDRVLTSVEQESDCTDDAEHPWGGGCNAWWDCGYLLEREIEFGAPATITWKVPRALLTDGVQGATLQDPHVFSYRVDTDNLRGGVSTNLPGGSTSGIRRAGLSAMSLTAYQVDSSEPGRPFTFALPLEDLPPRAGARHWEDQNPPNADPRADFLWLDIEETPERLALKVGVGQVDEIPRDARVHVALGLSSGHVLALSLTGRGEGGAWGGYASYQMPYYDQSYTAYSIVVPIEFEVVAGTPGEIRMTLARSDLPFIASGGYTTLLTVETLVGGNRPLPALPPQPDNPLKPGVGVAHAGPFHAFWEWLVLPSYRFIHDTPLSALAGVVRVTDAVGDAKGPQLGVLDTTTADQFDITYIEARAVSDTETHLTVGIRDLSRATVPAPYDGMFYGLGIQSGDGATMVGYYKKRDDPAGTFLCAQDITVLAEKQRDPAEAVWSIIGGVVSMAAPSADGAASGNPGAITFHVPHACFPTTPVQGDRVVLDRFAAATFLVRGSPGGIGSGTLEQLDEAAAEGAVTVRLPRDETITPAWYSTPFGVDNFWDMAGMALAALAMIGAGGVKLHHRRRDKRAVSVAKLKEDREVYKAALAQGVARGTSDPDGDEVLQALRRRLGIGEREHALMLLEARAAAGLGTGLAEGDRFLGKYRIERQLGEGGFAKTFLARDENLARRVVLKVAAWDSEKEAQRALKEGRLLAQLDHPNIVTIHDVEEVAGELVLVLEHLPRGSLAARLQGPPLPAAEALRITDDVLAALEAAHAAGIVHRDVKPANILMTADGRAKLADFGIARGRRDLGTVDGDSLSSAAAGTVRYMAPEQARGVGADARTDLYAVGAVLYEMIAGRRYLRFDGLSDFDARLAILEDPPELPLPGVPEHLNDILRRALAKDPADRPRTATVMRHLLAATAAANPRPPGRPASPLP